MELTRTWKVERKEKKKLISLVDLVAVWAWHPGCQFCFEQYGVEIESFLVREATLENW